MYIVQADNVAEAYRAGMSLVGSDGIEEQSRNGPVRVLPRPLVNCYNHPRNRVLMDPLRDANPFFHLYEAMWMLVGENSLQGPKNFNSNISTFSDDGLTLNGAYGARWRVHFGYDQIKEVVALLDKDPHSRRAVLGMWDPREDLTNQNSKDLPCNTHIYFRRQGDHLHMTVCCRSNDLVWGCYGANVVHMSVLHEYVAGKLELLLGTYYQVSNNAHVYERHYPLLNQPSFPQKYPYETETMKSWEAGWDEDCREFVHDPYQVPSKFKTTWFRLVMSPFGLAHQAYRNKHMDSAVGFARQIEAEDWRQGCVEWLMRRQVK